MSFEDNAHQKAYNQCFLSTVETKDYNVLINDKNYFDQSVKNDKRTYDNNQMITTGQRDDYTTACLLDYIYFKNYFKMIDTDLSKQQELDADPKVNEQISFTGNLDWDKNTTIFVITEEAKETILNFSKETVKVL